MMRWDAILRRLRKGPMIGVEVGVWNGRCSGELLGGHPDLTLYMVDRWERPEPGDSFYDTDSTSRHSRGRYEKVFRQAKAVAARYPKRARIIRKASLEAAQGFAGKADFVFVDGDHSYDGVKADLAAWVPHIVPGGLLCGHDYKRYSGVQQAVDEWRGEREIELGRDDTYFIQMP